jgi:hypothetical protein
MTTIEKTVNFSTNKTIVPLPSPKKIGKNHEKYPPLTPK